jgi:hypothetical protein
LFVLILDLISLLLTDQSIGMLMLIPTPCELCSFFEMILVLSLLTTSTLPDAFSQTTASILFCLTMGINRSNGKGRETFGIVPFPELPLVFAFA